MEKHIFLEVHRFVESLSMVKDGGRKTRGHKLNEGVYAYLILIFKSHRFQNRWSKTECKHRAVLRPVHVPATDFPRKVGILIGT